MSNRRRTTLERQEKKMRRRCPKCGTTNIKSKDYTDAMLHICQNPKCGYPVREAKR